MKDGHLNLRVKPPPTVMTGGWACQGRIGGVAAAVLLAAVMLMANTVAAQDEDAPARRARDCPVTGCPAPLRPPGLVMPSLPDAPLIKPKVKKRKKASTKKKKKSAAKKKPAIKKTRRSTAKSGDKSKAPAGKDTKAGVGKTERIRLIYVEKQKSREASATAGDKVSKGCKGGSLTAGVNCVTTRMDQTGGGGGMTGGEESEDENKLRARLQVVVTPKITSADDGATYKITLDVGAPNMDVPRDLDPNSRVQALRDILIVVARLRQWQRTLNAEETKELKEQGYLTRPLVTPFRGLEKMRLVAPVSLTVRLDYQDMELRLRFVRAVKDGFALIEGGLRYGQQFFVEARYKTAPDEIEQTVRLFYDDLPGKTIKVARTADDKKLYRSKGYHLMYGYDDAR